METIGQTIQRGHLVVRILRVLEGFLFSLCVAHHNQPVPSQVPDLVVLTGLVPLVVDLIAVEQKLMERAVEKQDTACAEGRYSMRHVRVSALLGLLEFRYWQSRVIIAVLMRMEVPLFIFPAEQLRPQLQNRRRVR